MAKIDPLTTRGTGRKFVEFYAIREGSNIVLSAVMVQYNVFTGSHLRDVLNTKMLEDEEDAINVACDLEWLAAERLDETNDIGTKSPGGFAEEVEKWLDSVELKAA